MIQGKLNTRLNEFDTISLFVTNPFEKAHAQKYKSQTEPSLSSRTAVKWDRMFQPDLRSTTGTTF